MDISTVTSHFAGMPATGVGALVAAWLVWRLSRRLFRLAIICAVVALVAYLFFPEVVHHLVRDERGATTSSTGYPNEVVPDD